MSIIIVKLCCFKVLIFLFFNSLVRHISISYQFFNRIHLVSYEALRSVVTFPIILTKNAVFLSSFIFLDLPFILTIIFDIDVVARVIFHRVLAASQLN